MSATPLPLISPTTPVSAGANSVRFFGATPQAFDAAAAGWGWPKFRARQVREWAYGKLVTDPRLMTNLSVRDRGRLASGAAFDRAEIARRQDSEDGTRKLLLTWAADAASTNGAPASAETVMIPDDDRRTACVSSQVGCPVGCTFCASGINGLQGNLAADQIVEQVFQLNRLLGQTERPDARGRPPRVTNVVFMGMGEPLANYNQVLRAVRILHDPSCFNIGARRITISTVGVPSRMRELAREELPLNLALSLHAPNESLRRQLIPWAEHFALDEILDACGYYFDQTGREVTLEYILLAGVNDRPEHARELSGICRTMRANVNLIRYNEVEGLPHRRPRSEDVVTFQNVLRHNGVNAHVRKSRGRDIDAACGQLRRTEQGESKSEI